MSNSPQVFSHFDAKHWGLVYDHRRQAGIPKNTRTGHRLQEHPLLGKLIELEKDRGYYRVREIYQDWWRGWYLMAFLETPSGSHRICPMENVACHDESILQQVTEFRAMVKIVDE